jgi:hypothetical protein
MPRPSSSLFGEAGLAAVRGAVAAEKGTSGETVPFVVGSFGGGGSSGSW